MSAARPGLATKAALRARLFPAAALLFVSHVGAAAQAPAPFPPPEAPRLHLASRCEPAPRPAAHAQATACSDLAAPGRLEASQGRRSHALAGAGIGFVVGAGATLSVLYSGGSTAPCNRSANQDAMAPRECIGLTALGGLAGAGLGAVIGAQIRTGRGQAASVERRPVALAPLPARGVGLALAVAF